MISPIGLEGLRSFYNKIPDNVRERTPSVMVQNGERLNPSGSKLPEKIIAIIGAAAFALGAAGCNGETHSEPTPDTTTSTSQESESPSSEPSPEVSASSCIKFEGDQELIEDLKSAKTDGGKRNAFVEFARKQTDKPMAETNSMGTTATSKANLVDKIEQLGRDSTTTLEAALNLVADGCISDDDKRFTADAFISSSTAGQASMSLGRAFDFAISFPDDNEDEKNEVSCKEVLYTAEGKEIRGVKQPTYVTRNNLTAEEGIEKRDPLQYTELEGSIFASQTVCKTNDGQPLIEQMTLINTSSDEDTINNLATGKQADKMMFPYFESSDITDNNPLYASWTILTHRSVNPGSQIPALYEGESTTLGEIPAIKEALAEGEEVRTNK